MTELYPRREDTLTSRNITDSYNYAYHALHGEQPDCQHVGGRWFMVNGERRERYWLVMEIDRLRKEAVLKERDETKTSRSTSNIFKMIRRLSRL